MARLFIHSLVISYLVLAQAIKLVHEITTTGHLNLFLVLFFRE